MSLDLFLDSIIDSIYFDWLLSINEKKISVNIKNKKEEIFNYLSYKVCFSMDSIFIEIGNKVKQIRSRGYFSIVRKDFKKEISSMIKRLIDPDYKDGRCEYCGEESKEKICIKCSLEKAFELSR